MNKISNEDLKKIVSEVVYSVISENSKINSLTGIQDCLRCKESNKSKNRAIITSTGKNNFGIVASITKAIADFNGDIRDISQTILGDFFTMMIVVDISKLKGSFKDFQNHLKKVAKEINVEIVVIHEDILTSMHRI